MKTARPGSSASPPRRNPLSEQVLRQILRQLDERERELTAKIADERQRIQSEGFSQLEGETGDDVDRAFVTVQVGMERELIDRCVRQVGEIAAARDRIARGEGGICVDCGDPIGRTRLRANPVADRCTECQARRETEARVTGR